MLFKATGEKRMALESREIFETIKMISVEALDIRTVTLGLNIRPCADTSSSVVAEKVSSLIYSSAKELVKTVESVGSKYGIPVANKRIALSPVSNIFAALKDDDYLKIAKAIDKTAGECGVDFVGGYSAIVDKAATFYENALIESLPEVLASTEKLCSSVNVASTKSGINMDAVSKIGKIITDISEKTKDSSSIGCAKLVVFANAVSDNPFMAGAFWGESEGDIGISVGISGPGVVRSVVAKEKHSDFSELAEAIKKASFKITRAGELVGREVSKELNIPFNIVDLSLAPTTAEGDSVAEILELMGLEKAGTHGSTAALYILTDAVKKGGIMASSRVGGLSGAFIPVSEDVSMIEAVRIGAMSVDKLEALTAICSVGLDMLLVPGDTKSSTLAGLIADEMAIGVINKKTTAVRVIPVYGKSAGDRVDFGGLLGYGYIATLNKYSSEDFIKRGGRIPAPIQSFNN